MVSRLGPRPLRIPGPQLLQLGNVLINVFKFVSGYLKLTLCGFILMALAYTIHLVDPIELAKTKVCANLISFKINRDNTLLAIQSASFIVISHLMHFVQKAPRKQRGAGWVRRED